MQAREQRNDKRARILDAAVKVFAERGYFSSTVAEIARAAGVADGTIYLYFKSKDDLLLRLFDEKMTQLLAEAKAALAEERDAPSRLKRFIQLHFSLVEKNPDLASVLVVDSNFPVIAGEKAWNSLSLTTDAKSERPGVAKPWTVELLAAGLATSIVPERARVFAADVAGHERQDGTGDCRDGDARA